MQEAELKHGRLAMLAVVGFVATDLGLVAPGAPTGLSSVAAHDVAVQKGSMYVLLFFASLLEVAAGVPAVEQMMKGSGRKPGDFAFGARTRCPVDPPKRLAHPAASRAAPCPRAPPLRADLLHMSSGGGEAAKKLAVNEVKNGRLAMLAFSGIVTQAALTGHGFPYN